MHLLIAINLKCYYMVPLIAINSINRSLLETMENNSLACAYTNQQQKVGCLQDVVVKHREINGLRRGAYAHRVMVRDGEQMLAESWSEMQSCGAAAYETMV